MQADRIGCYLLWLLTILVTPGWAADHLTFPQEPSVPTAPAVTHINIKTQPIFDDHKQVLPQAWVLHVHTSGSTALVTRLQQAGFSAYLGDDNKTVYIGPSVSQAQLLEVKKQLKQRFNMTSSIEDYHIIWPTQKER